MRVIGFGRAWLVAAALGAAGCVQVPAAEAPVARYELPTPLATTQINLPIDAIRVAAAIVDRLHGGTGAAAGVSFGASAGDALDGSGAGLPGFDWRNTVLLQYTAPADDARLAAGELRFDDPLGRRAAILFTVEYGTVEPIEIREIAVSPLFQLDPVPVLYVVEADAFAGVAAGALDTPRGLLAAVTERAIPWRFPAPGSRSEADHLVIVFLMDRVSASAEFAIGVSAAQDGAVYGGQARYIEESGWRAAILPGRFGLGQAAPFIKATFRPGSEVDPLAGRPREIGVWSLDPRGAGGSAG